MLMAVTLNWINRLKVEVAKGIDDGQRVQLKGNWWLKKRMQIGGGFGALGYDLEASGVVEINGGSEGYGGWIE
ncbi:hypothetical protein V6N13_028946 [Hibiscus sabdariffa]|uniref:Uncharacterized protein n=2 Tax=Hibiscus sabdariffa TaxID=183260 RepID=A0ABR2AXC5_9ROSI